MRQRWLRLCAAIGPRGADEGPSLFGEVEALYAKPPRAHHNLAHIAECLGVFDSCAGLAADPALVEWALWLHDGVYEPGASDNEARSAEASAAMLARLGAPAEFAARATGLILATRHTGEALEGDAALVADIDMSILGASPERYDAYAGAIRTEFACVSEPAYRRGAFLEGQLARPRLYHGPVLRERFEGAARANIGRELQRLAMRPGNGLGSPVR